MIENIRDASKSWIIKIMLIFIALSFVSWGGYYYFDDSSRGNDAITVNNSKVSFSEYKKVYYDIQENLREQFKSVPQADKFLKQFNIEQLAIDSIVERSLLRDAAIESGLVVSDEEVAATIQSIPFFRKGDVFDNNVYLEVLKANNFTAEYFEMQQRDKILLDKMVALVQSPIQVTEAELRDEYLLEYGKGNAKFIKITPADYAVSIEPTQDQIKDFFAVNKAQFMGPEKLVVEYVEFNADNYLDTVEVDNELIEDYYYENTSHFSTSDSVHAKHILLKVTPDSTADAEKELYRKAERIIKEIKEGLSFEEAAKKYSQDTTAENGGDVGTFTRNQMVKEFEDAAFSLEKGAMTEKPVKTFYGYHIIKVIDAEKGRVKPLEEVRNEVVETLKAGEAKRVAKRIAKKFVDDANGQLTVAAKGANLPVKEVTATLEENLMDMGLNKLKEEAFATPDTEKSLKLVETDNGYLVGVVKERIAPQDPTFTPQLEAQVRQQLKLKLALEMAAKLLEEIKGELSKGANIAEIASQRKLMIYDTGLVGKRESIINVDPNDEPAFKKVMFSLKKGGSDSVAGEKSLYVLVSQEPVVIDEMDFEKEKVPYEQKILAEKREFIFKEWVNNLRKKASVTIHPSLVAKEKG